MSKQGIGLYLHVPFCAGKCPYCDFYSLPAEVTVMERYAARLTEELAALPRRRGGLERERVKTVYFGGGTPNLLGAKRLAVLLAAVKSAYVVDAEAEVTAEVNPTLVDTAFFQTLKGAGFNRISMGLQSANEEELRLLGRKHSTVDVERAFAAARDAGFDNISLDLMLGLPGHSLEEHTFQGERLGRSIDFATGLEPEHISCYLLKIEEGTPFAQRQLSLPEDDEAAALYLYTVEELAKRGYAQYEISNFAKPGRESRHNLVYWRGEEYLGLGPAAHSFYRGKRFFYPRSLEAFLQGEVEEEDGSGGDFEEYAMLTLRLTAGLRRERCEERFGAAGGEAFDAMLLRAKKMPPGLLRTATDSFSFTPEGFLLSNTLLVELMAQ